MSYYLMCKDVEIISFSIENNMISKVEIINKSLLPEILKLNDSIALHEWLKSRSIDVTRSNARILLKLLKISTDEISAVIYNKALNLTDSYWIKENLYDKFSDLCLYSKHENQLIVDTSLNGVLHELKKEINAELTNIGSFNKAWIKENSDWWLYKRGSLKNSYAELYAYYLAKELGMAIAEYKFSNNMIASLNFTNDTKMLEHYASFKYMFSNRSIDDITIFDNLKSINLENDYSDILLLDAIICNPDRHEYNFGVIKNTSNEDILNLAPNFDNNLALGSDSGISTYLLKMYLKEIGIQKHQKKYIAKLTLSLLKSIDKKVKHEIQETKLDSINLMIYFNDVLKLL